MKTSTRKTAQPLEVLMAALFISTALSGPARAFTVSFQEGVDSYAGTEDSRLYGQAQDTNYGALNELDLWEREVATTNSMRTLIRFNLSSLTDPSVTNASLTLTLKAYVFGTFNTPTSLYLVNAANSAWTESSATWKNAVQSGPTPWAGGPGLLAGTDYNATPIATVNTPSSAWADGTLLTFNLNAAGVVAINNWIANPGNNYGFFITQGNGSPGPDLGSFVQLYSSEDATTGYHPLLTLEIPEPSALLLVGVGGLMLWRRRA